MRPVCLAMAARSTAGSSTLKLGRSWRRRAETWSAIIQQDVPANANAA
jgi:hypothetical protein